MKITEYKENTYTQENRYYEPWQVATELKHTDTMLHLLIEDIATEFSGLANLYNMKPETIQNILNSIDALYSISWKVGRMADELDAYENRPGGTE